MHAGELLIVAVQRFGYCAFLLNEAGSVLAGNVLAADLLKRAMAEGEQIFRPPVHEGAGALRKLLGRATKPDALPRKPWIIEHGARRLLCSLEYPWEMQEEVDQAILLVVDLEERLQPKIATLQELFSLTNAESKLAWQLAKGGTMEECAEENKTSINTARVQLRSIFAKTGTTRQSDLVALLNRVAMLG